MSGVRVHNFSVSIDGYGAGIGQSLEAPLGVRGEELDQWVFSTAHWHQRSGEPGGSTGIDDAWLRAGDAGIGATGAARFRWTAEQPSTS